MNKTTLSVPTMNCGHCQAKIQEALKSNNIEGNVDLENKTVLVDDTLAEAAKVEIEAACYPIK